MRGDGAVALIPRSARRTARIGRGPFEGVRSHEMSLVYLETEQAAAHSLYGPYRSGYRFPPKVRRKARRKKADKPDKPTHAHVAIFNGEGDGITTEVRGHSHLIRGLELEAAADGHTHELGETRVAPIAYRHYRAVIAKGDSRWGH